MTRTQEAVRFLGQTQDENLREMIEVQNQISALADSVPSGAIPKERTDAIIRRLDQCRAMAGTPQGVQCARQALEEFRALVAPYHPAEPAGIPTWAYVAGGAVVVGGLALLLSR